jgi:hypothetical protein
MALLFLLGAPFATTDAFFSTARAFFPTVRVVSSAARAFSSATCALLHDARAALRDALASHKLVISAEDEARIDPCTDLGALQRWHRQALEALGRASLA